jgi:hypothetical protein
MAPHAVKTAHRDGRLSSGRDAGSLKTSVPHDGALREARHRYMAIDVLSTRRRRLVRRTACPRRFIEKKLSHRSSRPTPQ